MNEFVRLEFRLTAISLDERGGFVCEQAARAGGGRSAALTGPKPAKSRDSRALSAR